MRTGSNWRVGTRGPALTLGLLLGCTGTSGPSPSELIDVTITAFGTIRWEDGTPIRGAIVSAPSGYFYPSGERTTKSGSQGTYRLNYRARCTAGGLVASVNVELPPQTTNYGGSCTGVPTCHTGEHRRDCVFNLSAGD